MVTEAIVLKSMKEDQAEQKRQEREEWKQDKEKLKEATAQ